MKDKRTDSMLETILTAIENDKEKLVGGLLELIQLESSDGRETAAQVFVSEMLEEMGFSVECFREDPRSALQPDYIPYDFTYDEGAYNVAGQLMGCGQVPSLMLFAHIDTEAADYFGKTDNHLRCFEKEGKIFGLGASDDKGGIAMMLYAVKYLKKYIPQLPYDLCVMSILGKHGGGFGTLSAMMKGYTGAHSIYLHPAETGHGFAEIKNISLGIVDADITAKGKPGAPHDDLATGVNAAVLISKVALYLEEYNRKMRRQYIFDFGSFAGEPSYILNIGTVSADGGYGGINQTASLKARIRFFHPLTIDSVFQGVTDYLNNRCREDNIDPSDISVKMGAFRASPAMISSQDPFIELVERGISEVTGISEFIHQYHGGSDIRLPMIYGNSCCVGIGPTCVLPEKNSGQMEWISTDDYINGIKILVKILYDYQFWNTIP